MSPCVFLVEKTPAFIVGGDRKINLR